MKKIISIQIQPQRINKINEEEIAGLLERLVKELKTFTNIKMDEGFDGIRYININVQTKDIIKGWNEIQKKY